VNGDRLIRASTAAAVLLVAAIAAAVSYQHLYHLAVTHGETGLDAALMPLSIDGTVVTGSLLMLRCNPSPARMAGMPAPIRPPTRALQSISLVSSNRPRG